jgi:hypothetical protein
VKLFELSQEGSPDKALRGAGIKRIYRDDVDSTVQYVSAITGISVDEFKMLGSSGKVPSSGDIDLAVPVTRYNPEQIHQRLISSLGADYVMYNKGTRVGSYAVPIAGKTSNGRVQVDLMYVSNPDWAAFSYFSAGDKSQYKGVVRNMLLSAVAATINEEGTDHFIYDDNSNQLIARVGRSFDVGVGVKRVFQYRPKKQNGLGYLSSMKSVDSQELKQHYPNMNFDSSQSIIDDPEKVCELLFGKDVHPSDIETTEQVLSLISVKFDSERKHQIFALAKENLKSKMGKINIPTFDES